MTADGNCPCFIATDFVHLIWPILALLLLVTVGLLHTFWRKRWRQREQSFRDEISAARLRHEQAMAESQAQQHALFNSMVEGLLLLDPNGRVILANQALEKLFGLQVDIRGKTVIEAFRLHELSAIVERLPAEKKIHDYELKLPGLEERVLQVNASLVAATDAGSHGSLLVFRDLTRLKQLENTRQEFVANVSHELRTPLSLIKGYVETLIDGAKDDPVVATKFLHTIERHADRLTYLIEDLLTISKLESGQEALNVQSLELATLVDKVLEDLQARAAEKNVTLQNNVPPALLVPADGDRLQQVFSNLISNAIKYGRAEGMVTVAARAAGTSIEVSVEDHGPGIPPEALERVFERFYRGDKARARDHGGTGLGLAIVKHIVQRHGGDVWATSQIGQGSIFFFTLPMR